VREALAQGVKNVFQPLTGYHHGIGIIGKRQAGYKDLTVDGLPGMLVDLLQLFARKVDKEFTGRLVLEHHRRSPGYQLLSQVKAELRVAVALRISSDSNWLFINYLKIVISIPKSNSKWHSHIAAKVL